MLTLGTKPVLITVLIPREGQFTSALVNDEGDWPENTSIQLRFETSETSIEWDATITGPNAVWDKTPAECDAVLALHRPDTSLFHTLNGIEVLWGRGQVESV